MAGLRPGQKHSGSFKKGYDPRRGTPERVANGRTLAQLARSQTEEMLRILVEQAQNPKNDPNVRMKAAQYVLDRGWGRAASNMEINVNHKDVRTLSTRELEAIAAGEVIDGEYTEIARDVKREGDEHESKQLLRAQ